MTPDEPPPALPFHAAPHAWIPLGAAVVAAIDACARAFASDGREVPSDADDETLFPFAPHDPEYE
ncbi:hypothetical protein [Methylobacterium oryzihabitans]|uniref:hypothetical protein n=1 Tax=Methylobacterium oryzihabitans TaxID=2499852 RepID=UPI001652499F|nr:hypothetical protein [Methylobacterium oryzihabitans]